MKHAEEICLQFYFLVIHLKVPRLIFKENFSFCYETHKARSRYLFYSGERAVRFSVSKGSGRFATPEGQCGDQEQK